MIQVLGLPWKASDRYVSAEKKAETTTLNIAVSLPLKVIQIPHPSVEAMPGTDYLVVLRWGGSDRPTYLAATSCEWPYYCTSWLAIIRQLTSLNNVQVSEMNTIRECIAVLKGEVIRL